MYKRKDRVAQLIQTEVSEMILKELKDPRIGFVSVTDVKVAGDLRYATVYFTVFGGEKDVVSTTAALERATGYIRREVGARIRLRYTPEIRFKFDEVFQRAWHLEEIIQSLHEDGDPPDSSGDRADTDSEGSEST